jgi:hypothetical protein
MTRVARNLRFISAHLLVSMSITNMVAPSLKTFNIFFRSHTTKNYTLLSLNLTATQPYFLKKTIAKEI